MASIHYSWPEFIRIHGGDKTLYERVKDRIGHPVCRVSKARRYECSADPLLITCRACLKRMALAINGEGQWRKRIIECYTSSWVVRRAAVSDDLDLKRLKALDDCARGDHSPQRGVCLDCGRKVPSGSAWPI